jgi:hypothetical protein
MYHLFRIGMTAESIRLKENKSCEIAANRTHIAVVPLSPMSKQQLSTGLQPREEPAAAKIIKLHNIAVFFGNQTLMIAVKCGKLLAKEKDSLSQGQWLPWVKRNLPSVRPGLLQADKQRMIRDVVKPIRVVTRRLKHQAALLNLNYEN